MALRADKVSFNASEPATATLLLREDTQGSPPAVELPNTIDTVGMPSLESLVRLRNHFPPTTNTSA